MGILIADAQAPDRPLIYVNPAFEQITGYAADEVLGRNCRFLQAWEQNQPGVEAIRSAIHDGREGHALLRNYRKDGTPFWNELVITPVHDADGRLAHYIGVMKDITQRKQTEEALERYEFIANVVGEMMSVINREHRYEAVNDRWCAALGKDREAVLGASVGSLWGEAVYASSIAGMVDRCFREGQPISVRAKIEFPDVGERDCDITYYPYRAHSGEVTHVVVVTRDVSDQLHAEQARQASESHLRTVLDSVLDGIIVIDERGTIESFNPAAQRIFGYLSQDVLGRNINMLMPEPYHSRHDGYLAHYLATGEASVIGRGREVTGRRMNGGTFPMDLAVSEMHQSAQRKFVGIVRDISDRKHAEMETLRTLEMAQAASKAKSEFLSSMSHELRTPLNAILGFAQLLEMDPEMGQNQADDVREILKAGQHLLDLINEVLDLSRIESGNLNLSKEAVALAPLINECITLVDPDAGGNGIRVEWDMGICEGRHADADRLRLKQVLLNLLSNAIKYNRPGGSVRLECKSIPSGRLRLTVSDTGLGIPLEKQDELFTAFQRLGQERSGIEGTGIGLVICKRLMEMMDGGIGMESRPDVGSTFWIEVPEAASNGTAIQEIVGEAATKNADKPSPLIHTVLYLEDNPANLKLMQHILTRRRDIRLVTSEEPEEALELARLERPDLILLDINLPGMDGYAVLSLLRQWRETRATPVIGVSANAMVQDILQAKAAGFDGYITKPLDIESLMDAIDRALKPAGDGG